MWSANQSIARTKKYFYSFLVLCLFSCGIERPDVDSQGGGSSSSSIPSGATLNVDFESGFSDSSTTGATLTNSGFSIVDDGNGNMVASNAGSNNYIDVTGTTINSSYTKSIWAKHNNGGGFNCLICSSANGQTHVMALPNANYYITGSNGAQPEWPTALEHTTGIASGVWKHIAITYDAATTTMIAYLDGVEVASDTSVVVDLGDAAYAIGSFSANRVQGFIGSLDNVLVYPSVLTSDQIDTIYQLQRDDFGI